MHVCMVLLYSFLAFYSAAVYYDYDSLFLVNCRFNQIFYSNGDVYVGNFKDELFHGNGKFTLSWGSVYEGDWIDGDIARKGRLFLHP